MRVPLVYFSASGNTEYVCQLVKRGFESQTRGGERLAVELLPVKTADPGVMGELPLLGLASPVYEFNFAPVMREWISRLPDAPSRLVRKVFLVDTSGGIPGGAITSIERDLRAKQYTPLGALEIPTPTIEPFLSNRWYPARWKRQTLDHAYYFGALLAQRVLNGRDTYLDFSIHLPGLQFLSRVVLWVERTAWAKSMRLGDMIGFRPAQCTACRACERACPRQAIDLDRDPVVHPTRCMLCATCVRVCPQGALYLKHRPKARLPRRQAGPGTKPGYVAPARFTPSRHFTLRRSLWHFL